MNNRDGGPASPVLNLSKTQCPGMTMRQYYKAAALPAVIRLLKDEATDICYGEYIADLCKAIADAMLEEDEAHAREEK